MIDRVIARLSSSSFPSERFDALRTSLQAMSAERAELRQKLELYRVLQKQLHTLKNPQDFVQSSLVTRDGTLVDELSKSKMLGIGVAGRVAGTKRSLSTADNESFTALSQKEKIKRVLKDG
jgi:Kinetochore complex Fta4 of Sim4 subunit, or CENP-50